MNQWFISICFALGLLGYGSARAAESELGDLASTPRTWTTKSGVSFNAIVVGLERDTVDFKREQDDSATSLPLANLIRKDESLLRVAYFGSQDRSQLQASRSFLDRLATQPQECVDTLKLSHLDFPDSPYAGLWASICLSAGGNKNTEAMSMLRQVLSRIDRQREFDPARHSMTYASTLNNLAICMIKDHKAEAAAGLLAQGLDSAPADQPVLIQNATQLLGLGKLENALLTLSTSTVQRLEASIASRSGSAPQLPTRWLFSIDANLPELDLLPDPISGLVSPSPGSAPKYMTTGLSVSPDIVIASRAALGLEHASGPHKITITYVDSDLELHTLSTNVLKEDASSGLVALQTGIATLTAIAPQVAMENANNDIAVFAYSPENGVLTANSLRSFVGKTGDSISDSFQSIQLSPPTVGPAVNRQGRIIGLSLISKEADSARIALPSKLMAFALQVADPTSLGPGSGGFSHAKRACVLVTRWQESGSSKNRFLSQEVSAPNTASAMWVADDWCIACQGIGFIRCGRCQNGKVKVSRRVQIGFNSLTNTPIFGNKSFNEACPACSGRGGSSCRHCNNGKLGR